MAGIAVPQDDLLSAKILQAALRLYLKHGLKKVTLEDVAKAIGKSRSVLYYYYKNKEEIFGAVLDKLIADIIAEITTAVNEATTLEEKIKAYCRVKIKPPGDRKTLFRAMEAGMNADEISRHAENMSLLHIRLMQAEKRLLKQILTAGNQSGAIRKLTRGEMDRLSFILQSGIRGVRREMAQQENDGKLEATVAVFAGMVVRWLRP